MHKTFYLHNNMEKDLVQDDNCVRNNSTVSLIREFTYAYKNYVYRCFTLIELLLVIAILSILMSILLPALNRAKAASNSIVCKNRLKQCYSSQMFYASDYDGWLWIGDVNPFSGWYHIPYGDVSHEMKFSEYKLGNAADLVKCPLKNVSSNNSFGGNTDLWEQSPKNVRSRHLVTGSPDWQYFLNMAHLMNPSNTFWQGDCRVSALYCAQRGFKVGTSWSRLKMKSHITGGKHLGIWLGHLNKANLSFSDGHTESCNTADLRDHGFRYMIGKYFNIITY